MPAFHKILQQVINTPFFMERDHYKNFIASFLLDPQGFFLEDEPSYNDESNDMVKALQAQMADPNIHITRDFADNDIPDGTIAYHRVFGTILADESWWWFSTKQFMKDFRDAENNPHIGAHFMHVKTGGGEAWLLDKAFEMMVNRQKPLIVFAEKYDCSAGLYLSCPADKFYTYTQNDTHGSLGTMIGFWDLDPYFIKMGLKLIEEYATKSDLKNKKFKDLKDGKPKKYIEEELNPLQEQFETAVRSTRSGVAELEEDHPAVRGETFYSQQAEEYGLIDGTREIEEAILEAYEMGQDYLKKRNAQNKAVSYL